MTINAHTPDLAGVIPARPTPLHAGVLLSVSQVRKLAEALVTIQEAAAFTSVFLIDRLDVHEGDSDLEEGEPEEDADASEEDDPAEEDTEDCDGFENEPAFDKASLRKLKRHGDGPGCPISDTDFGAEEIGEREEGVVATYGVDQSKGPDIGHHYNRGDGEF